MSEMSEKGKAFWLGLFIFASIVIICGFVIFLRPSLGDGKTKMRVLFTNIDKINIGSRVTVAGKPVGEVYKIRENKNARTEAPNADGDLYFYELLLKVDSGVKVYTYDTIGYATSGLLGEKTIDITPRATPPNAPEAQLVTQDVLRGEINNKLDETMTRVINLADSLQEFIDDNKDELHNAIHSFELAATDIRSFTSDVKTHDVMKRLSDTMEKTGTFFTAIDQGGTFSRLMHSDNLYLRLNSVLAQFETTLNDINRFGLFFQFSGKWQREQRIRQQRLNAFLSGGDFTGYFHDEMSRIQNSIDQISDLLETLHACDEIPPASYDFRCLLQQVHQIQKNLELYNEALNKQRCQ